MSKTSTVLLLSLLLFTTPRISSASELYFLEDNQVLLYKIINWWYDSPKEEGAQLCGDELRYETTAKADVDYSVQDSSLTISLDEFASMLSVVKECETCPTSASTGASWINEKYLSNSLARLTIEESTFTNRYVIRLTNIEEPVLQDLLGEIQWWTFTLTGRLQGLQNGKVTLNPQGDHLKKCSEWRSVGQPQSDVYLNVIHRIDGTKIMRFNNHPF